ncbi:MAG: POTRA domain-containing protein [Ideonella sp.]|nr:POTRA domain-containing protein [Ideonella sp.]
MAGNTVTRDEVIRREFRQFESSWYDGAKIKLSRDRVERLGFFNEVAVETNEVPGAPDQVDLAVNVTEKPTGSLLLAAGYSQTDKLTISVSIQKENIFGSGNRLGLDVNTGKTSRNLVISTHDPYFTDDWSLADFRRVLQDVTSVHNQLLRAISVCDGRNKHSLWRSLH